MSRILRNDTQSDIMIDDTGINIEPGVPGQYTIPQQDSPLWAASNDIIREVGAGNIVVNDGSVDCSLSDGIDLIKGSNTLNVAFDIDQATVTTTKGDLLVEDGSNVQRLGVGANDKVLTADSIASSGLSWKTAPGAGGGAGIQNPFDISWKIYAEEFCGNSYATPYGPISLFGAKNGTGAQIIKQSGTGTQDNRVGIYRIISGSSAGAWAYMANALGSFFPGDNDIRTGHNIKLVNVPDATDDYTAFFGLSDTAHVLGTNCAGIMVDYAISTTNWVAITRLNGTSTTSDTGIALTTDWGVVETIFNTAATSCTFYIDGVQSSGGAHGTNIPKRKAMGYNHRITRVAGAAREFQIDVCYYAFKPGTARGLSHTWIA